MCPQCPFPWGTSASIWRTSKHMPGSAALQPDSQTSYLAARLASPLHSLPLSRHGGPGALDTDLQLCPFPVAGRICRLTSRLALQLRNVSARPRGRGKHQWQNGQVGDCRAGHKPPARQSLPDPRRRMPRRSWKRPAPPPKHPRL